MFTGLSWDYPGTVPGLSWPFPEISCEFCLCVPEKGKHINNLTPTHFQDDPAKLFVRGPKVEHKRFLSQTLRAPPGYPSKTPWISCQKVWFPWASKDMSNFLAPTPSCGRPPPHPKISGPKSLGLGSFFFPDLYLFIQQLRFGVFREGVFQKMPALQGQFLTEISMRFAGENHLRTQKNTKQSSAQRFLNDPFPKTPFFSCWFMFIALTAVIELWW